jgi:biopolymer transport protein TolR
MPSVASGSRRAGSHRRTINEINMVPFIDVMLVLLIIFMVSAPLISTGVVDLPTVGASRERPERVIEVVVAADEGLQLKIDGRADASFPAGAAPVRGSRARGNDGKGDASLRALVERVREAQGDDASVPVVISADRGVKYESVVKVMDGLQRAGVQRVGLSVKSSGA